MAAAFPADIIPLPRSFRDEGYGSYQYRPTLILDGASAYYHYWSGGTPRLKTYGAAAGGTFDGRIFVADVNNNLNVYSSSGVVGKVTVATALGKSIVPVGNVTVQGYNFGTGAIDNHTSNNNMIGLVSGGYIAFNKTWIKHFNTDAADINKYVSEQVTGGAPGAPPGASGKVGTLHMTTAIMAVCHFNDLLWNGTAWQTFPMSGTEWWEGMWGTLPFNPNGKSFTDFESRGEDYSYQLYGNHILAAYARTIYGIPQRGCQGTVTFNHDPRMFQRNLQPPGFPGVKNGTTLLTLRMKNWSVENTF